MSDNNSNKTTTNEFVNPTCLDGLEILREHRLVFLNTPQPVDIFAALCQPGNGVLPTSDGNGNQQEESKETFSSNELLTSWQSDKVQFDNNGCLVSLDLGGKRLHKGIPCDPCVFGKFQKLKILSLAGTDLPLKDILAILQEVAANNNGNYNDNDSGSSSIESLYLGGNGLGNVGIEAIVASKLFHLPNSSNLTKLDLRYNDIGSVGMGAICRAVMGDNGEDGNAASTTTTTTTTSNLQFLYMEGNIIGDEGCDVLAKLLSSNHSNTNPSSSSSSSSNIREIYLGGNQIGPTGAKALANCLNTNKTVSKIYLECNALGDEGAIAFCQVLEELKGDTGLKHLYVDNNKIGKEVSNRLGKALRSETAIPDIGA
uniref:RNI-like protein n=1 Tax=Pseudo-nitzschia australis TaxID=44445 RepID=A0A7S4AER0_9STRA|eukprot:CAMPEP_0168193112 /NCGR_PEP_ID=MMETSP0139_2-20121125/18420_1 /TAXON_ID=44445 /ORGANISM="Pseudo-nitzschia australis, Strain 10249 10 AB" /LENGTH=370 /DNA_ID=CAMNT_0008116421 /DNA_START=41 /DNA_END=1153 /DNA_ORIENTATION=-